MAQFRLPQGKPVILDGGLGRELRFRGVEVPSTIWSAGALMTDPDVAAPGWPTLKKCERWLINS